MTISPRQLDAARRHPWLRAAYHHAEIVRQTLADARISADPNSAVAGAGGLDTPDATIGSIAIDVIPNTRTSHAAHQARPYINAPEQLITYQPPTPDYLAEVFHPADDD